MLAGDFVILNLGLKAVLICMPLYPFANFFHPSFSLHVIRNTQEQKNLYWNSFFILKWPRRDFISTIKLNLMPSQAATSHFQKEYIKFKTMEMVWW